MREVEFGYRCFVEIRSLTVVRSSALHLLLEFCCLLVIGELVPVSKMVVTINCHCSSRWSYSQPFEIALYGYIEVRVSAFGSSLCCYVVLRFRSGFVCFVHSTTMSTKDTEYMYQACIDDLLFCASFKTLPCNPQLVRQDCPVMSEPAKPKPSDNNPTLKMT